MWRTPNHVQELQDRVNRVAAVLTNLGVRPEQRVLLLMLDVPEMVYAFFGAIRIGAVPVPLNTLWTSRNTSTCCRTPAPAPPW